MGTAKEFLIKQKRYLTLTLSCVSLLVAMLHLFSLPLPFPSLPFPACLLWLNQSWSTPATPPHPLHNFNFPSFTHSFLPYQSLHLFFYFYFHHTKSMHTNPQTKQTLFKSNARRNRWSSGYTWRWPHPPWDASPPLSWSFSGVGVTKKTARISLNRLVWPGWRVCREGFLFPGFIRNLFSWIRGARTATRVITITIFFAVVGCRGRKASSTGVITRPWPLMLLKMDGHDLPSRGTRVTRRLLRKDRHFWERVLHREEVILGENQRPR